MLFGIPAERITGMHYTQLFSEESRRRSMEPPRDHDAEGRWASNEVIARPESGEHVPIAVSSCVKNIQGRDCVLTILRVRDPERPGSAPTSSRGGLPEDRPGVEGMVERLSRREKEVVRLVSAGLTNRQIAKTLFLSVKTIETHRARIMEKLGFHKTAQIVRFAVYSGLCGNTPE